MPRGPEVARTSQVNAPRPGDARDAIAFSLLDRVGCRAFRAGVERHGSAAAALLATADPVQREAARHGADAVLARAEAASVSILVQGEPEYPAPLLDLPDAPGLLFALGTTALAGGRRVGIVGTRHASPSGERIAHAMAAALVHAGAVVVSGMAFGIDAAAHRGALDGGGGTIAVLGGGVDVPYPPSHAALHGRIVASGLVLSEAAVGSRPAPGAFPRRNRLIAALSETLIVVEAGERSGALITARIALELGRNVAAVPGPIDSPRHVGSNRLLSDGAAFVGQVVDVLSIAGLEPTVSTPAIGPAAQRQPAEEDPAQLAILAAVLAGASDVDDLARSTRLSGRELAVAMTALELSGRLRVTPAGSVVVEPR